jgi:hypothetical protein
MRTLKFIESTGAAAALGLALPLLGQTAGFAPSVIGGTGILAVRATDTYYDGNNGTLFAAVPLPAGASRLQFRVTGGVITDGSDRLGSADGLYANGQTPYNWTDTRWNGTYQGTPVGATTGIDPSLFGVFFNPAFAGTPPDSPNFRSDTGETPDPRTLLVYTPLLNQPFYIGDGYTSNNAYVTNADSYIPPGTNQTYVIPPGATYLLLGIGADPDMADNQSASNTNSGFLAHVFDDSGTPPVISAVAGATSLYQGMPLSFSVLLASGATPLNYQWSRNGVNLTNNARVSGAQSTVLSLTGAQAGDSGVFGVVVSNSLGQAASNVTLTVYTTGQTVASNNLSIPANAEIHGAGNAGLPDSSGVAPILVNLPANAFMVSLSNVSGLISLNGGSGHNDADGVLTSGGGYPSSSYAGPYGGISGITIPGAGALIGLFESATPPSGSPPPSLDFTVLGTNFTSFAPALYQTFFMGDGLTGDGSGTVQQFLVPAGATRLFLGITDAGGFNGSPGGYGDNSGAFTASVEAFVPDPQILQLQLVRTNLNFDLQTFVNQSYTIQQTMNIAGSNWSFYSNFIGDGLVDHVNVPATNGPARFFRVTEP